MGGFSIRDGGIGVVTASMLFMTIACQAPTRDTQSNGAASPVPELSASASTTQTTNAQQPSSLTTSTPAPSLPAVGLEPGTYCFAADTATLTAYVQLAVAPGNTVYGNTQATIHDQQAGYYSAYTQVFEGQLQGDRLDLNIITEIELDTQNAQETWTLSNDAIADRNTRFDKTTCDAEVEPPTPVHIVRTQFDRGAQSAVMENAVIRGERDIYLLNAQAGQQMQVHITSPENNAVVDILAPGGEIIQQEVTQADLTLPSSGDFQMVVGGTRGNASYRLDVSIK